jgi:ADP-ribose pyrophosphatase
VAHKWSGRGWTRLSSDVRFTSEWFVVRRDEARRPDGSVGQYDHVVAPPAVTVLAVDDERRVAVTRQWIYTHREPQWRLPAGRIDDRDCSPEAAARRELVEETGVAAREWTALGSVNGADSLTDHRDHAFLATGLTLGEKRLEAGEADLELHWFPAEQVVGMTLDGLLPHAGSTFAILSAKVRGLL